MQPLQQFTQEDLLQMQVNPRTAGIQNSNNTKKIQVKNKDQQWCNYCKKKGHTKEICWKLKDVQYSKSAILTSRGSTTCAIKGCKII